MAEMLDRQTEVEPTGGDSLAAKSCTDPIVGAILSGWRYDISSIAPEMRTDYEQHLLECVHCRRRQTIARTIDVLLISVTALSIVAFLLAAVVIHRIDVLTHVVDVHLRLHQRAITVSLEAVAIVGLVISSVLCVLVAVATPLPGFLSDKVQQKLPPDLRQRFGRHHA